jgi:hypothetical protein
MKKQNKKKNRTRKSVNNHKIRIYHKSRATKHNVSRETIEAYAQMIPIYQELSEDFERADLIDLEFYERWLNG